MSAYQTILLAIDLTDEARQVSDKARNLCGDSGKLHVIHVIEPLSFAYGGDIPMDFSSIQEDIQKQASSQLAELSIELGIASDNQHITIGRPETEIHNCANEIGADVVVIGSHGRHGLALLLGSTANGVLHGAGCDVLAVRVGE